MLVVLRGEWWCCEEDEGCEYEDFVGEGVHDSSEWSDGVPFSGEVAVERVGEGCGSEEDCGGDEEEGWGGFWEVGVCAEGGEDGDEDDCEDEPEDSECVWGGEPPVLGIFCWVGWGCGHFGMVTGVLGLGGGWGVWWLGSFGVGWRELARAFGVSMARGELVDWGFV